MRKASAIISARAEKSARNLGHFVAEILIKDCLNASSESIKAAFDRRRVWHNPCYTIIIENPP
jgi:hypothetical protein